MVYKFESVAEFARHLENAETNTLFQRETCSALAGGKSRQDFTTTKDFAESISLIRFGDAANYKKLVSYRAAIKGGGEEFRQVSRLSVVGGSPCVPAYLRGVPASMIDKKRMRFENGKIVNIAIDCTFAWFVSSSDIMKVGANMLAVIMGIEKKGYQVNLYAMAGGYAGAEEVVSLVRIKSAGVHVDGVKLAYFLVNPSFLRRSWFRLVETTGSLKNAGWVSSYGHCMDEKRLSKHVPAGFKFLKLSDNIKKEPAALEAALLR